MSSKTQFGLICLIICIIGVGLNIHINNETKRILRVQNIFIPMIATKSFFLGCIGGSRGDIELCKRLSNIHEDDISSIIKVSE
jgi:hypothetical protein